VISSCVIRIGSYFPVFLLCFFKLGKNLAYHLFETCSGKSCLLWDDQMD